MPKVLSLVMIGALITSCADDRKSQVDLACQKVQEAWDVFVKFQNEVDKQGVFYNRDAIDFWSSNLTPKAEKPLREAGEIFRDLSTQDSGFAQYASKAFEMAQKDFYTFWSVDTLKDLTAYCGTKIEGSGNQT